MASICAPLLECMLEKIITCVEVCLIWSDLILSHITTLHDVLGSCILSLHQNYQTASFWRNNDAGILMYLLLYFVSGYNKQRNHLWASDFAYNIATSRQFECRRVCRVLQYRSHSSQRSRNKWSAFCRRYFKCVLVTENVYVLIPIPMKFILPRGHIEKSSLVQAMVWNRTGVKLLYLSQVWQFTEAYMRQQAIMSYIQCGAVITRSIFSKILAKYTP